MITILMVIFSALFVMIAMFYFRLWTGFYLLLTARGRLNLCLITLQNIYSIPR